MEKTILQNMYNFNEPKVALVSRKDSKGCYDFVELNGYIVVYFTIISVKQ